MVITLYIFLTFTYGHEKELIDSTLIDALKTNGNEIIVNNGFRLLIMNIMIYNCRRERDIVTGETLKDIFVISSYTAIRGGTVKSVLMMTESRKRWRTLESSWKAPINL